MRQVIYCSRAIGPGEDAHLDDILRSSNTNNPEIGITGVLMVTQGVYLQFLEGPKESLRMLLEFIEADERHTGMEVLAERPTKHREFADWAMGYQDVCPDGALGIRIREALKDARADRCAATSDRLLEAMADIGRTAIRETRRKVAASEGQAAI